MPEKEGAEEKTTKSVVNKKQKQMMGEEGYDHLRDMGRIRKNKKKKDATSYPPSDEVKKTQKKNKGPSALEIVKKKYEGQIMDVKKEELDLTKVAEAFGGYIVEKKEKKIGSVKPGEKEATKNLIRTQADKPKLSPAGQKRLTKISNPTKITDQNFERLKKRVSGEISADADDLNTVANRTKSGSQPRIETGTYNYSKNKPQITGDVPSGQGNILTGKEDPLKTKRKSGGGRPRGSRTKIKTTPGQQRIDLGDYGRKARKRTPDPERLRRIKKKINIKEPTYVSPKTGKKLPVKLGRNLKNIGATTTKSVQTALKQGAKTTAKTALKKGAVKGTGKLLAKRIPGVQQTIGTGLAGLGMARDIRKASTITNVAKKGIQGAKAARGRKGFAAFMKPARKIKKSYAKMPADATELGKKVRGKTTTGRRIRAALFGQEFLPGGGIASRTTKALTGAAKKAGGGSGVVGRRSAGGFTAS